MNLNNALIEVVLFPKHRHNGIPYRNYEQDQERILREKWQHSKSLPRKAKKKLRQEVRIDWSILQWEKQQYPFL